MHRQFRFHDCCLPIAAFFLVVAGIEATEPVGDCAIKGPAWLLWLFPAFGFGGAGLSHKPLRGALKGLGIALVPAAVLGLFSGLVSNISLLPFLAILAVLVFNAIRETIRVR
jgi:hypothetical protein